MNELNQLLDSAILSKIADIHTAFPARILTYDFRTQRASVEPVLNKRLLDNRIEKLPVISNVPVVFMRSGGASITMPVRRGDNCLIICTERSLDEWLERGGTQIPQDRRKHAIFDATAIMGLNPFSTPSLAENNDDVLITYAGSKVRIKPNGDVQIQAPNILLDGNARVTGNLKVDNNLDVDGTTIGNGINLNTHTHGGVQTGAGSTGVPNT